MVKTHNMALNMPDLANPLRDALKEFLDENCQYNVKVTRYAKHSSSSFPVVELKQMNSTTGEESTNRYEQIDDLQFELNVYAKTITLDDGTTKTEVEVAEDIMFLINELFDVKIGMIRTLCEPAPELDIDVYRIIMRYRCSYNKRRNIFIRR